MKTKTFRINTLMVHIEYIIATGEACRRDKDFAEDLSDHEENIESLHMVLIDLYVKLRSRDVGAIDIDEVELTFSQLKTIYKPLLLIYEKWEVVHDLSTRVCVSRY